MADVFLNFVNMSLTACWLILAVVLLRLIFRRAPRWVFCLLWGFVGLRLVLPFSFESIFSLIPTKTPVKEVNEVVNRVIVNSGRPMPELPLNQAPAVTPSVPVTPGAASPVPPAVTAPAADKALSLGEIFAIVWICGIAVLLVYAAVSYLLLRYKIRTATRLESNVWQSEAVSSPFVLGFIKPRIYLPYALDALDIPYVLSHERAHISRRDHLIKPLGFVILAVYWFNPVIWLAYVLLCRDVELACDEKVIKTLGKDERRDYSTALLNCSVSRVRIAACPIAFGEVAVKERIKGVMNYKKPAFWIIILAVIAIIVTAVCFLTDPKSKDDEKEDDVKEKEITEEKLSETVEISNVSYECDSDDMQIELVSETVSRTRPQIKIDFINNSYLTVKLSTYKLYFKDGDEWKECTASGGTDTYVAYKLYGERSMRLIRNLDSFDMTKPGQYCLWQEFCFDDFAANENNSMYARVFFQISDGLAAPLNKNELIAPGVDGYVRMLTEYLYMPSTVNHEFRVIDGLYLAARYSYENDMPFVKTDTDSFGISREDMLLMFNVLTGVDANVETELDQCHVYLEQFGDSYDYENEVYVFTLDRNGWGERDLVHTNACTLDPEKDIEISENGDVVNVTAWITHPDNPFDAEKKYYRAEFVFEKIVVYDRIVYTIKDVFYHESPADTTGDVSVIGLTQDPQSGFFTEFMLKTGDHDKVFKGKAWADKSHNLPYIVSLSRENDFTGDGIADISVIFRTEEYDPDYPDEMGGRNEIHVFDGATLDEIPGLEDVPQRIQDSLDLSFDGEVYTIGLNGNEYHVNKKWYEDTKAANFYDLPSFTEKYNIFTLSNSVEFTLICVVNETFYRYDTLDVSMAYKDGKFVVNDIDVSKFWYSSHGLCGVHDNYYHSFDATEEDLEDWFREVDSYGYDNDGCNSPFNIVSYAKRFGITGQQLRDNYYLSYYYYNGYFAEAPLPLFELDEEGCDEFFRNNDKTDEEKKLLKKRLHESNFKNELIESMRYSSDSIVRNTFYKYTENGTQSRVYAWSIPELVYEAQLSLEEIETAYAEFAEKQKDPIFEYDFERLFSDREYFEDLIETAEYPVFVDEALRK